MTPVKDVDFLEYVIKAIVDQPEEVKVSRQVDERGVLIVLSVSPKDMGIVIGRQGYMAKAIRQLLRAVGARNNARVNLKIEEPAGSNFQGRTEERTPGQDQVVEEKKEDARSIDDIVNDIK